MRQPRNFWSAAVLCGAFVFAASCAHQPPPKAPQGTAALQSSLVVIVPGITGSKLCDGDGRVLWGDVRRLIIPWDGGYSIALPIGGDDDVAPCGPIRELRIGHYRKDIYGGLLDFLEVQGFATHFFDYDWRRDNTESARLLAIELRGRGPVSLICQSNGTYICRHLVRYGDMTGIDVDKIIMVGTANGGGVRILRELNRGRQYFRFIGRRMRPETLFTFPSMFQDLPPDPIFDPENWEVHDWSVFAPDVERRIDKGKKFGTLEERREHLRKSLDSGRRLHATLKQESRRPLPRYYSIQSSDQRTPARVVIDRDGKTQFTYAPGDRHATVESQQTLSNEEKVALGDRTVYVKGRHFEMITTPETRQLLLRWLSE